MKKSTITLAAVLTIAYCQLLPPFGGTNCSAQNIGINSTGATPNASSLLDLNTGNTFTSPNGKGLLIPNVALSGTTDAATIATPATSLLVYNLGTGGLAPAGYYYNSGTSGSPVWVQLLNSGSPGTAWRTTGNAGTTWNNNFLGTTDNVSLRFRTNNVERMYVDSFTGNVGIGTAGPANALHLYKAGATDFAKISFQNNVNTVSHLEIGMQSALGGLTVRDVSAGVNLFHIQRYSDGGNVGIGTINPSGKFQVTADLDATLDSTLIFTTAGKVGIGTIAPDVKLDIIGAGSGSLRMSDYTTDATNKLGRIVGRQYTNANTDFIALDIRGLSGANEIRYGGGSGILNSATMHEFFTANNTTTLWGTSRMIITSAGNVGIGTTSPVEKLTVIAPTNGIIAKFQGGNAAGIYPASAGGLYFSENFSNGMAEEDIWSTYDPASYPNTGIRFLQRLTSSSYRDLMFLSNSGNVGIGTTSPNYQLELSTNSAAKPSSTAWTVPSDERLKRDVRPFTQGLDALQQINPIWFKYNGEGGISKEEGGVGAMAQDIQKIAPYMIKPFIYTDSASGTTTTYMGVDYGALDFILVNAIKELKAENDGLKAVISKQQAAISSLQTKEENSEFRIKNTEIEIAELKAAIEKLIQKENTEETRK